MTVNKKAASFALICTLLIFCIVAAIILGFIFMTKVTFIVIGCLIGGFVLFMIGAFIFVCLYDSFGGDIDGNGNGS